MIAGQKSTFTHLARSTHPPTAIFLVGIIIQIISKYDVICPLTEYDAGEVPVFRWLASLVKVRDFTAFKTKRTRRSFIEVGNEITALHYGPE